MVDDDDYYRDIIMEVSLEEEKMFKENLGHFQFILVTSLYTLFHQAINYSVFHFQ